MNETLDLLRAHRSIRAFTDDPVPDAHLEAAIRAGQAASTSSHIQAASALEVLDRSERERLVELTGGQPWVRDCARFLVVCGDIRRHQLVAETHAVPNAQNLEAFLLAAVDATLFAQNVAIALESLGYGVCYIGGLRNRLPEVIELLEIPFGVLPLYGLCVGVPDSAADLGDPAPKPRLPLGAVLHRGRYADDETLRAQIADFDRTMGAYYASRGKPGHDWSGALWRRFSKPAREHLRACYESLGASFR
jgi:nitroreductase